MSQARGTRRAGLLLACVGLIAFAPGCRNSPFQRHTSPSEPRPVAPSIATTDQGPAPEVDGAHGTLAPSLVGGTEGPATSAGMVAKATPMLDAALRRAEAEEHKVADEQERLRREVASAQEQAKPIPPAPEAKSQAPPAAPAMMARAVSPTAAPASPTAPPSSSIQLASKTDEKPEEPEAARPPEDLPDELIPRLEPAPAMDEHAATTKDASSADGWKESLDRLRTMSRLAAAHGSPATPATEPPAFAIAELRLCRKVVGFGSYEGIDPGKLKPGQALILYSELAGLSYEPSGEQFRSRVASRLEILSAPSGDVAWSRSLGEAEDHAHRRRQDNYVSHRISLPDSLAPGEYRLRLTVTDLVAGRSATTETPLTLSR